MGNTYYNIAMSELVSRDYCLLNVFQLKQTYNSGARRPF